MTRCKHSRVEIIEEYVCASIHIVIDGQCADHNNDPGGGSYTGWIEVNCFTCGYSHKWNRYVSVAGLRRVPQWVQIAAEAAGCSFVAVRR